MGGSHTGPDSTSTCQDDIGHIIESPWASTCLSKIGNNCCPKICFVIIVRLIMGHPLQRDEIVQRVWKEWRILKIVLDINDFKCWFLSSLKWKPCDFIGYEKQGTVPNSLHGVHCNFLNISDTVIKGGFQVGQVVPLRMWLSFRNSKHSPECSPEHSWEVSWWWWNGGASPSFLSTWVENMAFKVRNVSFPSPLDLERIVGQLPCQGSPWRSEWLSAKGGHRATVP